MDAAAINSPTAGGRHADADAALRELWAIDARLHRPAPLLQSGWVLTGGYEISSRPPLADSADSASKAKGRHSRADVSSTCTTLASYGVDVEAERVAELLNGENRGWPRDGPTGQAISRSVHPFALVRSIEQPAVGLASSAAGAYPTSHSSEERRASTAAGVSAAASRSGHPAGGDRSTGAMTNHPTAGMPLGPTRGRTGEGSRGGVHFDVGDSSVAGAGRGSIRSSSCAGSVAGNSIVAGRRPWR